MQFSKAVFSKFCIIRFLLRLLRNVSVAQRAEHHGNKILLHLLFYVFVLFATCLVNKG